MPPTETDLADLSRRVAALSRAELMTLAEGVFAEWRAEQAHAEKRLLDEVQVLLAQEAALRLASRMTEETRRAS